MYKYTAKILKQLIYYYYFFNFQKSPFLRVNVLEGKLSNQLSNYNKYRNLTFLYSNHWQINVQSGTTFKNYGNS